MNATLLNEIKNLFIDFANKEGIILAEHFETPDKFKEFIIAIVFTKLKELGLDTDKAFDAIFGAGAFKKLADDVFESLNAAA